MKKTTVLFIAVMAASWVMAVESFRNPGREFHPETWFHLIGGNVSKEGMSADLDAIAQAGISGIHLFHGPFLRFINLLFS